MSKTRPQTYVRRYCTGKRKEWIEKWQEGIGLYYDPKEFDEDAKQRKSNKKRKLLAGETPISHYALDGYKLAIPQDEMPEFMQQYARDVEAGHAIYLCEVPFKIRRLALDWDIDGTVEDPPTKKDAIKYVRLLQREVLTKFYPNELHKIGCVIAFPEEEEDEEEDEKKKTTKKIKLGMHVYFYSIFLTEELSYRIYASMVQALVGEFGQRRSPLNLWRDVLDPVFSTSLRMLGSDKLKKCVNFGKEGKMPDCDKGCDDMQTHRVHVGRPYFPYVVLNPDGTEDPKTLGLIQGRSRILHALQLCTTWLPSDKEPTPFVIPEGAPLYEKRDRAKTPGLKKNDPEANAKTIARALSQPELALKLRCKQKLNDMGVEYRQNFVDIFKKRELPEKKLISDSDHRYTEMAEWLRTGMGSAYGHIEINNMFKGRDKERKLDLYFILVEGDGSRYCQNVKRDHTTASIYFIVDQLGMCYQKCMSKKTVDRRYGPCRTFCALGIPIPLALKHILFPYIAKQTRNTKVIQTKMSSSQPDEAPDIMLQDTQKNQLGPMSVDLLFSTAPPPHTHERPWYLCRFLSKSACKDGKQEKDTAPPARKTASARGGRLRLKSSKKRPAPTVNPEDIPFQAQFTQQLTFEHMDQVANEILPR